MNLCLLKELCFFFSLWAIFCKMSWFSAYKADLGSLSSELLFSKESPFLFLEKPFLWFCMVFLFERILPEVGSFFYLQILPLVAVFEFL